MTEALQRDGTTEHGVVRDPHARGTAPTDLTVELVAICDHVASFRTPRYEAIMRAATRDRTPRFGSAFTVP
ncbi:hypothetical protein GCM10008944_26400 [Cytobacillus oceanisediminis]